MRTNFKKLLVSVLKNSIRKHLMFCTDDGFFYKEIHIAEELLASINDTAANTSFRMYVGQNVIDYPNKCTPISDDLLKWDYYDTDNKGHWAHTFSVDSTIYPLQTILKISQKVHYVNPNTYEGAVNSYCLRRRLFSMGLSPKTSAYFCLPINMVQNVSPNYAGKIDPMFLNEKFLSGYRITIPENLTINSKYYLPQKITLIKNKKELEVETHFKS
ncbi:MAG: hypothetical protein JW973_05875 [Bacteroidales bacterium]|nr:hypothetical protein [Bacteroidales bacterium]